jgi:hypothetical protein
MNGFALSDAPIFFASETGPQLAWAMLWFDKRSIGTPM